MPPTGYAKRYALTLTAVLMLSSSAFAATALDDHRAKFQQYEAAGSALDMLREAQILVEQSGGAPWAHYLLAVSLQKSGMAAQALTEYDKVLAAGPNDNAKLGRTQCLLALGKTREAVEVFESMAKQNPNNAELLLNLAAAYAQYHDEVATEVTCEKILKMHLTDAQAARATRMLANARLNHFDFNGALSAAKSLLQLDPNAPDAYIFVVREQLRYDKDPSSYRRVVNEAASHLHGKKEPFYSLAIMFDDRAGKAYRARKVQSSMTFLDLARINYQLALEAMSSTDPDWLNAKLGLATVDLETRNFPGALRNAQDVLHIAPSHPNAKQIAERANSYLQNDLAGRMKRFIHGQSL